MSVTEERVICCHMWCVYEYGMRIPFSKQYRYFTNHLHVYVTSNYICICTVILMLFVICFTLVNAKIFWSTKFKTNIWPNQYRSDGPTFIPMWTLIGVPTNVSNEVIFFLIFLLLWSLLILYKNVQKLPFLIISRLLCKKAQLTLQWISSWNIFRWRYKCKYCTRLWTFWRRTHGNWDAAWPITST